MKISEPLFLHDSRVSLRLLCRASDTSYALLPMVSGSTCIWLLVKSNSGFILIVPLGSLEERVKTRCKVKYFVHRFFFWLGSCRDSQLSGIPDYCFCRIALGMYYVIEISSSVQKPCLSILKPSGSSVASYRSYVQNKPKRQTTERGSVWKGLFASSHISGA